MASNWGRICCSNEGSRLEGRIRRGELDRPVGNAGEEDLGEEETGEVREVNDRPAAAGIGFNVESEE